MNEIQKTNSGALQNGMESRADAELEKLGRENSAMDVIKSPSPTFNSIKLAGDEIDLKRYIASVTLIFIKGSYPATDADFVSKEFAKELFERKDWKLADVKIFFKFIKDQASNEEFKVMGNSLGLMTLLKWVSHYEEQRSWAREQKYQEFKEAEKPKEEEESEKIVIGEEMQVWVNKVLKNVSDHTPVEPPRPIGKKLFDPVLSEEDYDIFLKMIPDMSAEEKEKFRTSVYNVESIAEKEMERKEQLLKLLK